MQSDTSTVANLCEVIVSNVRIGLFEFHTSLLLALYPKYVCARVYINNFCDGTSLVVDVHFHHHVDNVDTLAGNGLMYIGVTSLPVSKRLVPLPWAECLDS